tara:strand:- start:2511 stop:3806 length:1296 start_codon:yes stop_codon:yes gene_type:complete
MYQKKLLLITLFLLILASFFGCEPLATNNQVKTATYSKPINMNKESKVNKSTTIESIKESRDSTQEKNLEIGLLLPLSGQNYRIGRSLLNAAQLALDKTQQNNINFKIIDTNDEKKFLTDLYSLIEEDINFVIGPVFTSKVMQVRDILNEKNIPIISLSNNSILEKNKLFVFGLTLEDEINRLLIYSSHKNLENYSVVIPRNEYGYRVKEEIEKFRSQHNSLVFKFIFYDTNAPDFYALSKAISNYEERRMNLENEIKILENENSEQANKKLKRLKKMDTYGDLDFQAIMIFTQNYEELSNISSILPYYDVDPKKIQFMGNSVWSNNSSLKEPGLQNGFFTFTNMKNKRQFENEYIKVFNTNPHSLSSLTYDLVGLIGKLHNKNNLFEVEQLFNEFGFIGIDGWFQFQKSGKVLRKPDIYEIKNQKFILVK